MDTAEILREALVLPDNERTDIALSILDSVESPDPMGHLSDQEWAHTIEQRAQKAIRGESVSVPWEKIKSDLEKKINV